MQHHRSEGIVLKSLKFRDYDQILTVFTESEGILKLIVKGAYRANKETATPLTQAEFLYTKGTSELYKSTEISSLNLFLNLRQSFSALEAASDILQAILQSQLPQQPAPLLYQLLLWSFRHLCDLKDPFVLALSFRLKLLRHEGLLNIRSCCTQCGVPVEKGFVILGELFCATHAPAGSIPFTEQEIEILNRLTFLHSLSDVKEWVIPKNCREKIMQLFSSLSIRDFRL